MSTPWGGVFIAAMNETELQGVIFQDCHLYVSEIGNLIVENSSFTNSGIIGVWMTIVNLSANLFLNSLCSMMALHEEHDPFTEITIDECHFSGPVINFPSQRGINIRLFDNYLIENTIVSDYSDGVYVDQCQSLANYTFFNNSIFDNSNAGIVIYSSAARIKNNVAITENGIGIKCLNYSGVMIEGESEATHVVETQRIFNNSVYEIYTSAYAFPYIRYNAIWNDEEQCLLKWDNYTPVEQDISYNFWGPPENFNPDVFFEPAGYFIYDPVWEIHYGDPPLIGDDEFLYQSALQNSREGDYETAESLYKQVVDEYPQSLYSELSLKQLLPLEKYYEQNYPALKSYFQNDSSILLNENLEKIGKYLSAWCDVNMENYISAVTYYEDILDDPQTLQDSIFAVIDLGLIYQLIDSSYLKSSYIPKHPECKFATIGQYNSNTDYLLSLLPDDGLSDQMKQNIKAVIPGKLLQNVPNPFNGSTQIWYKLDDEASVSLSVYDYTGKRVNTINPGKQDKGSHYIEFSSEGLPSGIYFYTLELNGRVSDSKKMTVMR
jgi:tetratricopeptide (TPR) repeat protein